MEQRAAEHLMFVNDAFIQNRKSVVAVQRLFLVHFNVDCRGAVPGCITFLDWLTLHG